MEMEALEPAQDRMLQHTPSSLEQAESDGEMLDLRRGKGFCEDVRDHVLGRAIHEAYLLVFDDPADEMEADVDVLRARVVLVVPRERDGRLVVRVERYRVDEGREEAL